MSAFDRFAAFPGLRSFEPDLTTLPAEQRRVWVRLGELPLDAVLYGGTALALRLAHRRSVDFDLFLPRRFEPGELLREAAILRRAPVVQSAPDTLIVRLDDVRVGLFGVDLAAVDDPELAADVGLPVASIRDLAGTKVKALLDRAEQKDYRDIAALLDTGLTMEEMLGCARAIFGPAFDPLVALKAVTYFEDGDVGDLPGTMKEQLMAAAIGVRSIASIPPRHRRILPDGLPAEAAR